MNSRLDVGIAEMNDEIRQHFLVEGDLDSSSNAMEGHEHDDPRAEVPRLTHVDATGKAKMVDVSTKAATIRSATASASILMPVAQDISKEAAVASQLAGIRGAKLTSLLIPLCHPINLSSVDVQLSPLASDQRITVSATATTSGQTGVEMEALTAATFAALHLVLSSSQKSQRSLTINHLVLDSKTGGKSGDYFRPRQDQDQDQDPDYASHRSLSLATSSASSAAVAQMTLPAEAWRGLIENCNKKGDVLVVSRIAGLLAMQQNSFFLPMHTLPTAVIDTIADAPRATDLTLVPQPSPGLNEGGHLLITASSSIATDRSVLLGVAAAALTVYDMCKAASKEIQINEIKLLK